MQKLLEIRTIRDIYNRCSFRQFQDKPVDQGLIQTLLDGANQGPRKKIITKCAQLPLNI